AVPYRLPLHDALPFLAAAATDGDLDAFVDGMNVVADQLGVGDDAVITDPTGLEDSNRLSAADLALLGRAALADERVARSARQAEDRKSTRLNSSHVKI